MNVNLENRDESIFRRQFLLSPCCTETFSSWEKHTISRKYNLIVHKDLQVTSLIYNNTSLFLLGFIIDPNNPEHDNDNVLHGIADQSRNADDIFLNIASKCGRFVFIYKKDHDFRIFGDACGTRQIFYHFDKDGSLWCSSQPHIIAYELDIEIDLELKADLEQTDLFKSPEHWYPGTVTLFKNIFHLQPNHYLDIASRKAIRYWPRTVLHTISIEKCVQEVQPLLEGIIKGALYRFTVAFAISSGYDSRTLLAASRKHSDEIRFFTHGNKDTLRKDPDILIPSKMLNEFGLKHDVLVLPKEMDRNFSSVFHKNVYSARQIKGLNAYSIYTHFCECLNDLVVIYGNCSEITKRDRFRFPDVPSCFITGTTLAAMARMSNSKRAKKEFSTWLNTAKKLRKYNVNILDLMHWEQRVGNWGAMTLSEYDIVQESLCPYSCRKYIENMLAVPFKYRTNPDYYLHHAIMKACWPEVLEFEINPPKNKLKRKIENFLFRTNLYDTIQLFRILYVK